MDELLHFDGTVIKIAGTLEATCSRAVGEWRTTSGTGSTTTAMSPTDTARLFTTRSSCSCGWQTADPQSSTTHDSAAG